MKIEDYLHNKKIKIWGCELKINSYNQDLFLLLYSKTDKQWVDINNIPVLTLNLIDLIKRDKRDNIKLYDKLLTLYPEYII